MDGLLHCFIPYNRYIPYIPILFSLYISILVDILYFRIIVPMIALLSWSTGDSEQYPIDINWTILQINIY